MTVAQIIRPSLDRLPVFVQRGGTLRSLLKISEQSPNEVARKLVGLGRFELPTSPLSGVRSNQLSYRPKSLVTGRKSRLTHRIMVRPNQTN